MTIAYPEPRPKERVKHPDFYVLQNQECDQHAEKALAAFEAKVTVPAPDLSRLRSAEKRQEAVQRHHLKEMTGTDLTKLPGLDLLAVQRILSEIGLDMSRWPGEKHFCAWLNVAPNNRISGGKILSSKPRKNANRAAAALRRFPPDFYALHIKDSMAGAVVESEAVVNSCKLESPKRCKNASVVAKRRRPSAPANSSTSLRSRSFSACSRYHVSQKGMTKNKRPPHESNKRRLKRRLKRLLSQMDWNDFSTPQKGYNPTLARRRIIE